MKKLKQALGKEDTKKPKNMNLSYTMINDKKGKVSHNPVFVYVITALYRNPPTNQLQKQDSKI